MVGSQRTVFFIFSLFPGRRIPNMQQTPSPGFFRSLNISEFFWSHASIVVFFFPFPPPPRLLDVRPTWPLIRGKSPSAFIERVPPASFFYLGATPQQLMRMRAVFSLIFPPFPERPSSQLQQKDKRCPLFRSMSGISFPLSFQTPPTHPPGKKVDAPPWCKFPPPPFLPLLPAALHP